jgi:preprotein translocase subunit SecB
MESKFQLRAARAESISFTNHTQGNGTLKLGFKYRYNLHHISPGVARGELTLTAEDKEHPEQFSLTVTETGIFSLPPDMDRERAHVESFGMLFPHTSATVMSVSALAGVPPIIVPRIEVGEENIYRVELRPPKPEE